MDLRERVPWADVIKPVHLVAIAFLPALCPSAAEVGHTFTSSSFVNFCKIKINPIQACAPLAAVNSPPGCFPRRLNEPPAWAGGPARPRHLWALGHLCGRFPQWGPRQQPRAVLEGPGR